MPGTVGSPIHGARGVAGGSGALLKGTSVMPFQPSDHKAVPLESVLLYRVRPPGPPSSGGVFARGSLRHYVAAVRFRDCEHDLNNNVI